MIEEKETDTRLCVSCGRELVQTIDDNKELDGHRCCPNQACPRGWLLTASYNVGTSIQTLDRILKRDELEEGVIVAHSIDEVEDKERAEIFKEAHPKGLAPGADNTCALADPENWPCQWAIPDTGSPGPEGSLRPYHCPKTCDKIQIMKDGEAWSS